jgi:hypothetical protein
VTEKKVRELVESLIKEMCSDKVSWVIDRGTLFDDYQKTRKLLPEVGPAVAHEVKRQLLYLVDEEIANYKESIDIAAMVEQGCQDERSLLRQIIREEIANILSNIRV